jgi:hypothetical protein
LNEFSTPNLRLWEMRACSGPRFWNSVTQPRGLPRVAGDEHQLSVPRTRGRPLEVVIHPRRLSSLVDAEERDVQIVAGELEVVGIATEEGDGVLRREDQAHVLKAPVAIKVELPSVIEHHRVAAELISLGALLLDAGHLGLAGGVELRALQPPGRAVHPRGHVGDLQQLVHLDRRALQLIVQRSSVEAVPNVVALWRGEILDAAASTVMVGHHQPAPGDEARRAPSRQPRRGEADMLEPLRRRLEPVLLLDLPGGEIVERPHAFVGRGGAGEEHQPDGEEARHEVAFRSVEHRRSARTRTLRSRAE